MSRSNDCEATPHVWSSTVEQVVREYLPFLYIAAIDWNTDLLLYNHSRATKVSNTRSAWTFVKVALRLAFTKGCHR